MNWLAGLDTWWESQVGDKVVWTLYRGTGKNIIAQSPEGVDDPEELYELLKQFITTAIPSNPKLTVKMATCKTDPRGKTWTVENNPIYPTMGMGMPGIYGMNGGMMGIGAMNQLISEKENSFMQRIDALEVKFQKDREIDDLKREIDALKSEDPQTNKEKFLEMIMPAIERLADGFAQKIALPAPPAAVGRVIPEKTQSLPEPSPENNHLTELYNQMVAVDSRTPNMLMALQNTAKEDPEAYKQFIDSMFNPHQTKDPNDDNNEDSAT